MTIPPEWPRECRFHYKYFGELENNTTYLPIIIVPYGYSCTGRTPGNRPNVQPLTEWWRPIVKFCEFDVKPSRPVIALMSNNLEWEPELDFVMSWRGKSMRTILHLMSSSSLLISVETGILHLASATKTPTIFLSSATPATFAAPDTRCKIIRAPYADMFDQDEVITAAKELLNAC
jgi:hypothetical protein